MTGRLLVLGALALATLGVVVAVTATKRGGDGQAPPALVAVCDVARAAREGDQDLARAVFVDKAHEPLHALATAAAEGGDRAVAAFLLEAKNEVESAQPGPTTTAVDDLVSATRVALSVTGRPSPQPCP